MFQDTRHQESFQNCCRWTRAVQPDGVIRPELGASLFLISAIPSLASQLAHHLQKDTLDFAAMVHTIGLTPEVMAVVYLAANLYNGGFPAQAAPGRWIPLVSPALRQTMIEAIWLRTQELRVDDDGILAAEETQ